MGAFTFSTSFATLWVMDKLWGIRVDAHAEIEGLDLAEHGAGGYPEFGIADQGEDTEPERAPQLAPRPDPSPVPV